MPGPTNTQLIRELGITAATLEERADSLRLDINRVEAAHTKFAELLTDADRRLTSLEARFDEWRKAREETDRKRWSVWIAFLGSLLALLGNVIILLLKK